MAVEALRQMQDKRLRKEADARKARRMDENGEPDSTTSLLTSGTATPAGISRSTTFDTLADPEKGAAANKHVDPDAKEDTFDLASFAEHKTSKSSKILAPFDSLTLESLGRLVSQNAQEIDQEKELAKVGRIFSFFLS